MVVGVDSPILLRESHVLVLVDSPRGFTEEGKSHTEVGMLAETDSSLLLRFLLISEGDFFRSLTVGARIGFRIPEVSFVSRENTKVSTVREKVKDFF